MLARCLDIYPAFSLVELLHCCVLVSREPFSVLKYCHALKVKGPITERYNLLNAKHPLLEAFCLQLDCSLWHKGYLASRHGMSY